MLNLENILWVIPGVIFIHFYNRRRPHEVISLSGWPYIFFLVVIAAFTWLPSELITTQFLKESDPLQNLVILLTSIFFSVILFLIAQKETIGKWIHIPIYDNFYKKCLEWKNKFVLLILRNGKTYIGILWKYPENPKARHESQTVSIVPFKSGYRAEDTKKITWNIDYPEYKNKSQFIDMEIIIPRTEIITFGKFNKKVFEHLINNDKTTKKDTES